MNPLVNNFFGFVLLALAEPIPKLIRGDIGCKTLGKKRF